MDVMTSDRMFFAIFLHLVTTQSNMTHTLFLSHNLNVYDTHFVYILIFNI